jgi:tryptophan synthase beta chain
LPSRNTNSGRTILEQNPNSPGSLGIAISEAVERAATTEGINYALGSVLNHVLLHQTVIGQEAVQQLEMTGDFPDIVIAPFGGGSNFAGIAFPFLRYNFQEGKNVRCIAVEPASCPKLTKGEFRYDFGDTAGLTPLIPMYTLGHTFVPAPIHAGAIVSQLLKDNLIEASAVQQIECFEAGVKFAQTEGIIPAPESNHGIAQVIKEALKAKAEGRKKTILFNLSGHGYFDMSAYQAYFNGELQDNQLTEDELYSALRELDTPVAV